MRGKLGISTIVATVMTILITVAGVAIVWVAIVPMINENIAFSELDGRVTVVSSEGYTVYDADEEIAIVQIKRDVDEGVMNRIKIIFSIDGDSISSNVVAPESGQTKTYTFDLSGYGEPESVSVAAIFVSSSGSEKEGSVTSEIDIPVGNIVEPGVAAYDLGGDYSYEMPVTGLISWWKFDGDFEDSVRGNDGSCSSCPDYDDGAVEFNGIEWIDVGDDSSLAMGINDMTISAWIKTAQTSEGYIIRSAYTVPMFIFGINGGKLRATINDGTNGAEDQNDNGPVINDNFWHHVVLVFDRDSTFIFYKDGVATVGNDISSVTGSLPKPDPYMAINRRPENDKYYINGSIDEVMIYNKVLSVEDITAIYENQKR